MHMSLALQAAFSVDIALLDGQHSSMAYSSAVQEFASDHANN